MSKTSKTVVFFGNEKLATGIKDVQPIIFNALEQAGYRIEQQVTGPLTELRKHKAQLAVLASYGHIIPQRVLDEFPLGIINVHPSLLPRHRGPTPIEHALLMGDAKTGVSIMRLSAGMDTGPIYLQRSIKIGYNETKEALTARLQALGSNMLLEVLNKIVVGTAVSRKQPHPDRATYSKKLSKDDAVIDWTKPAQQIAREVRAYAGWPGSKTILGDIPVTILTVEVASQNAPPQTNIGEIVHDKQRRMLSVQTGDGLLNILELKPDGKKSMPTEAFLAGYARGLA